MCTAAGASVYTECKLIFLYDTYSFANPALRTAVEMALMAVRRELSSRVRLPVAPSIRRCSLSTNRVSVMESTSISPVILAMANGGPGWRNAPRAAVGLI